MSQGFTRGVQLDNDPTLVGNSQFVAPTVYAIKTYTDTALALKANDADVVHKTGNETIAGNKTFSGTTNLSGLTASMVVTTDGSKNLASSSVTTTELGYVSGVTSSIQTQLDAKTFSIPFLMTSFNPLDATNYFFGGLTNLLSPSVTNTDFDFNIGYACTVVGCLIQAHGNTVQGSSEDVTLSLRNNTANTTTTIGSFKTNATNTTAVTTVITGASISVAASDMICLQMNGTWATNPQGVRITGYLIVRL